MEAQKPSLECIIYMRNVSVDVENPSLDVGKYWIFMLSAGSWIYGDAYLIFMPFAGSWMWGDAYWIFMPFAGSWTYGNLRCVQEKPSVHGFREIPNLLLGNPHLIFMKTSTRCREPFTGCKETFAGCMETFTGCRETFT